MAMLERLRQILPASLRTLAGSSDAKTATWYTTPWSWRDKDGLYVGWNGQVWLYWVVPTLPLLWEDPDRQLDVGLPLQTLLKELGDLDADNSMGLQLLANQRDVHIISISWDEPGRPAPGVDVALRDFQERSLGAMLLPKKALFVGVQLRADSVVKRAQYQGMKGFIRQLRDTGAKALADTAPDRTLYNSDRDRVERILRRHGCTPPDGGQLRQLEAWYNLGQTPDALLRVADDSLYVSDRDQIELSALMRFGQPILNAPDATWALDAATANSGAQVISIRAALQPATVARNRARRSQRRIRAQMEEEQATGDLERIEDSITFQQAQETEQYLALGKEPLLANTSIVFARRVTDDETSYADELRARYGIEMRPLLMRQLEALEETLPCSPRRVNPFLQDLSLSMVAYAGLQGWSNLGDHSGAFLGLADPDYTPVWLDVTGAPAANLPPAMGVFGDPGSGKTYLCQLLATQSVLAGYPTIFINPKGFSSLSPFADMLDGTIVKMSQIEEHQQGYFDPFRFAEPAMAAEIATNYILGVLGNTGVAGVGFTGQQELRLAAGMKRGAQEGARCVIEALAYVDDEDVQRQVRQQVLSSTLFAVGVAPTPGDRYEGRPGLTLIEFDRKLDFPERGKSPISYSRSERIALATVRLVTRASLEILAGSAGQRGGTLIVDEAWTFLSSSEGLAALQQLGREGRSLNLLPIFATQRVDDLVREGVDMEGYMSRVLVMKLNDEREATAALSLCGLKPTQERIRWLRQAGPKSATPGNPGRPAMGIHRDLNGRHAAIYVGPVAPDVHRAFTTNPAERAELDKPSS